MGDVDQAGGTAPRQRCFWGGWRAKIGLSEAKIRRNLRPEGRKNGNFQEIRGLRSEKKRKRSLQITDGMTGA